MSKDKGSNELSEEETKLKLFWALFISHLKSPQGKIDFGYIWTDKVKKDFEEIKREAGKIAFILRKLHSHYRIDKERYFKEINDIRKLLYHLNRIEAKEEWVLQMKKDLERVILDVEKEKLDERKKLLQAWGFPLEKSPIMLEYLLSNWNETEKLAQLAENNTKNLFGIFGRWENHIHKLVTKYGLLSLGTDILRIEKIAEKPIYSYFLNLGMLSEMDLTREEFFEVSSIIAKDPIFFRAPLVRAIMYPYKTRGEFLRKYRELKESSNNKDFWTVHGLNRLGYLCCHVTNSSELLSYEPLDRIAYGIVIRLEQKQIGNCINDLIKRLNINLDINDLKESIPSASVISPKTKFGIGGTKDGSIGVIFDYGYIYQAYPTGEDMMVGIGHKKNITTNKAAYKTGFTAWSVEPYLSVNYMDYNYPNRISTEDRKKSIEYYYGVDERRKYNEILLRNWTVSSLFYSKGTIPKYIHKLQQISDILSFKEYINGAYWYRTGKFGIPKTIIKVYPIYEVDLSKNTWKIVYMPKNPNYDIRIDKPNNTAIAVPK